MLLMFPDQALAKMGTKRGRRWDGLTPAIRVMALAHSPKYSAVMWVESPGPTR